MKTYITQIDELWYAFAGDAEKDEVYSIGNDSPSEGGVWMARWRDRGITYVAKPCNTRSAAYKKAARHGEYAGEV